MDYSQARGNITELQCISKFMEFGIECSVPYGNGAKYDFIADLNGELIRVQCKSSKAIDNDSFMFDCTCSTTNTKKTTRYTYSKTIIDYFATFFNGKVYIVPVEECSTSKTLRTAPPKSKGVKWNNAEDYLLDTFLEQYSLNLILTE